MDNERRREVYATELTPAQARRLRKRENRSKGKGAAVRAEKHKRILDRWKARVAERKIEKRNG